ncbi:MAG: dienelactone hydrolase family protein [Acidimicrobiia bacterium]|nr:dienelactone hydrolase family protein [Acidimicrobiia bacterium]
MCFDHDSRPPVSAGDRPVIIRDLTLTSADGTEFMAFEAKGEHPSEAGVVVLPDVRGLFAFYKDLATRFAGAGHDAVAIDYFGRTAGLGDRSIDWDFWPHVKATTVDGVTSDTAAAVALLREANPDRRVFTVGFCFGGSNSWHQAAAGHGLSGAVGFYGRPRRSEDDSVIDRVSDMACPILALMGGADEGIPQDLVREFDDALEAAGIEHEVVVYPGAPHSFFDRKYDDFAAESADAWNRLLAFIDANS